MKRLYDFGNVIVDLDKISMVKSYSDNTIAVTFIGSDNPKRFGPLSDDQFNELINAWEGGEE